MPVVKKRNVIEYKNLMRTIVLLANEDAVEVRRDGNGYRYYNLIDPESKQIVGEINSGFDQIFLELTEAPDWVLKLAEKIEALIKFEVTIFVKEA